MTVNKKKEQRMLMLLSYKQLFAKTFATSLLSNSPFSQGSPSKCQNEAAEAGRHVI